MLQEIFCRFLEACGEIRLFFPTNPEDVLVAPQPCQLSFGILPRAELDFLHGFLHRGCSVCYGKELFVADGLPRRGAAVSVGAEQCVHFVQ